MAQPAWRLVGRSDELTVADQALGRLRQGYGSALVVLGEPGIGKTRLLDEIRARALSAEVVVFGSAAEFNGATPYGAFVAALDDYVRAVDAPFLSRLDGDVQATLSRLLPSYPVLLADRDPLESQHHIHRALRALLELLAEAKPHIVVLDDLHWADAATIATLGALLRRPPKGRVLLVLAARTRQAPTGLLAAVALAERSGYADRLDLKPLSGEESRELLDGTMPPGQVTALCDASGGNPFYLEQLVRMSGRPTPPALAYADHELPPLVAAALTEELAAIHNASLLYLRGAAVAGDPFDAELAAQTAPVDDAATGDALDELLARDVIRRTDVPRRFQFRHPLLRRAVYETSPGGWRLAAHERCAHALLERGATAVSLAVHYVQSGRHGDPVAIDVLASAGRELIASAPVDAARFLASALRLTPATAPTEELIGLGTSLAIAYLSGGRFADAQRACLDALALTGESDPDAYAQLTGVCASVEHWLGHHAEAHARLTSAAARLPATASRAALFTQLSLDSMFNLDLAAMEKWARLAVDGPALQEANGTALAGLAAALDGRLGAADADRARVAELVNPLPDEVLAAQPDIVSTLAAIEHYLDRRADAEQHIDRALRIARTGGRRELLPILFWSGVIHSARGAFERALDALDTAIEIARVAGHDLGIASYLSIRSLVASAMGDTQGALESAAEAVERTRTDGFTLPAVSGALSYATVLLHAGNAERALNALPEEPSRLPLQWQPGLHELTTRCHLALGNPTPCPDRARIDLDLPSARGTADRAAGAVALATGDHDEACRLATAALAEFERAGADVDAELTRILLGRALAAAGQLDRAAAELATAADRFDQWSAHGYRDQAERELRKLGRRRQRRSSPATRDGTALATLTGREQEVARLAARGRTNPQIAAELFLSAKTVETHLRNTFHKLHVTSRLELARLVDRAGPS